jgi:hypothetical protein
MKTDNDITQEILPEEHLLPDKWSLYFHFVFNDSSYILSYAHIIDIKSCEKWAQMITFVPGFHVILSEKTKLVVNGREVNSFSFFKHDILPEWEHQANHHGSTLTTRLKLSRSETERLWTFITCECARGAMNENVLGVQLTKKMSRVVMVKVDFWLCDSSNTTNIQSGLNILGKQWGFDLQIANRNL